MNADSRLSRVYTPTYWSQSHQQLISDASRVRDESQAVRQDARALRNETGTLSRFSKIDSDRRLSERLVDQGEWRKRLESILENLRTEMDELRRQKQAIENALTNMELPLEVVVECQETRSRRTGVDLVRDDVDHQLRQEADLIRRIQREFLQEIASAEAQMSKLECAGSHLRVNISDKTMSMNIDKSVLALGPSSIAVINHPDAKEIPAKCVTVPQWEAHSHFDITHAEAELQSSLSLRRHIVSIMKKAEHILETQQRHTDRSITHRIEEVSQALEEIKTQICDMEEEVSSLDADLAGVVESIAEKKRLLKVAESRLNDRKSRPDMELCRDHSQYGLVDETVELERMLKALEVKRVYVTSTLEKLHRELIRLKSDLNTKSFALQLDSYCSQCHQNLMCRIQVSSSENEQTLDSTRLSSQVAELTGASAKSYHHLKSVNFNLLDSSEMPLPSQQESFISQCAPCQDTDFPGGQLCQGRSAGMPSTKKAELCDSDFRRTTYQVSYQSSNQQRNADLSRALGSRHIGPT